MLVPADNVTPGYENRLRDFFFGFAALILCGRRYTAKKANERAVDAALPAHLMGASPISCAK
jgi:hypothetical protein